MRKKQYGKMLLVSALLFFCGLAALSCSSSTVNLKKRSSMIIGTWDLADHIEYGFKKDAYATLEFKPDGTAINIQYTGSSKDTETLKSVAKWKLDNGGTVLVWYDDNHGPDESWTILHLSKRGLSLKRVDSKGTISRRLQRIE